MAHIPLDPTEADALRAYAAANGRNWKAKLRQDWQRSRYPSVEGSHAAPLQHLRNYAGASWLKRFNFRDAVTIR